MACATTSVAQETTEARTPDVVYVGSPHDIVAKMLELAQVKKDDILYDPGCGDGRICVAAATKYGCKAIGFDLNPVRIRESLENIKRHGVEKQVASNARTFSRWISAKRPSCRCTCCPG